MVSFDTETLRDLRDRADRACQETRVLVEQLKSSTERARDYLDDAYDKPRDANEGRALMADRDGRPRWKAWALPSPLLPKTPVWEAYGKRGHREAPSTAKNPARAGLHAGSALGHQWTDDRRSAIL